MSGKKYKPALFELLGKGTVKPSENGSIPTPGWMRGQRKSPFAWFFRKPSQEKKKTESAIAIHGPKPVTPVTGTASGVASTPAAVVAKPADTAPAAAGKPSAPVPVAIAPKLSAPQVSAAPKVVTAAAETRKPAGSPEPAKSREADWLVRLPGNRVQITVGYWVLGLAAVVLLLLVLLLFRTGKSGEPTMPPEVTDEPKTALVSSSEKLKEIQQTEVRKDILPEQTARPAPAESAKESTAAAAANIAAVRKGLCLVICSHTNLRELGQVQAYFARKGVPAEIGQFDNRYVLYSMKTFESISLAKQSKLKETVVELGRHYNEEREKGAAIFQARTFESAWWINVDKIRQIR